MEYVKENNNDSWFEEEEEEDDDTETRFDSNNPISGCSGLILSGSSSSSNSNSSSGSNSEKNNDETLDPLELSSNHNLDNFIEYKKTNSNINLIHSFIYSFLFYHIIIFFK